MSISILPAKKVIVPLLAGIFLLQGCAVTAKDAALKYTTHNFASLCYGGVTNVRITYAGSGHEICTRGPGLEKAPADATRVPGFVSGSYKAFTGMVQMKWRTRDGSELSHAIDLNKEITDRRIPYDHPERVLSTDPLRGGEPTVIVEVNDRTANVYVAATLKVNSLDPAKRTVDYVDSYRLVYSRTL
ncbi:hypothetical protein [Massilia pseudoviolaceinigra]|uniref:hypothetical protein n=1 Tax=Massilia pseudoviolaceinigra TaxID=3057165 RepID=UPI002796B9EA|nr:hypothetical protein [Massilia sp. CCM 9206]MDQ1919334.1 hypothetical protein [Massilia sp. CCM 9206]